MTDDQITRLFELRSGLRRLADDLARRRLLSEACRVSELVEDVTSLIDRHSVVKSEHGTM